MRLSSLPPLVPPTAHAEGSTRSAPRTTSKVVPALALGRLLELFPEASVEFLKWAIQHHLPEDSTLLTSSSLQQQQQHPRSPLTVERIVTRVSEKIVDGLGQLYPRASSGEIAERLGRQNALLRSQPPADEPTSGQVRSRSKGKGKARESTPAKNSPEARMARRRSEAADVEQLNENLVVLASIYPSHPISYLRSILAHPSHAPAPLYLAAYALLFPLSPAAFGTPPTLLPHPRSSFVASPDPHNLTPSLDNVYYPKSLAIAPTSSPTSPYPPPRPSPFLPRHELFRSSVYKAAVRASLGESFPTLSAASIAGLLAEHNHDYVRTKAACERLLETRSVASRLWGSLTSSLRSLTTVRRRTGHGDENRGESDEGPRIPIVASGKRGVIAGRVDDHQLWQGSLELMDELWAQESGPRRARVVHDAEMAWRVNEEEYALEGQLIECCCCFSEESWEALGACTEGHLVCRTCINTHVMVLLPSLHFPSPTDANTVVDPTTDTLVPCPSCSPPCSSSLPLSTLHRHLTSSSRKAYDSTMASALSRFITQQARSIHPSNTQPSTTARRCPFCPFTVLVPSALPLFPSSSFADMNVDPSSADSTTSGSDFTIITPLLWIHRASIFLITIFLFPSLLDPSTLPNIPTVLLSNSSVSVFEPRVGWQIVSAHVQALVGRVRTASTGFTIFRCLNTDGRGWTHAEGANDLGGNGGRDLIEPCGRESCLGCGREIWGGVACCDGSKGRRAEPDQRPHEDTIDVDKPGIALKPSTTDSTKSKEKERDELRLAVERAMSEATIRTCPRCELGFTKLDSCNKMTCPRDGYKMCYVCRADVGHEGYQHFCPHFRVIPGPCRECTKCDLYLLADADQAIQAAGDAARRDWLASKVGREADAGWARGVRVGPKSAVEIAMDQRRMMLDRLILFHLDHLARIVAAHESWRRLLSQDPVGFLCVVLETAIAPVGLGVLAVAMLVVGPAWLMLG